jgi:hypothetical protein
VAQDTSQLRKGVLEIAVLALLDQGDTYGRQLIEPDGDDRAWAAAPTVARLALFCMAVAASLWITVLTWRRLPEQVPTHWGFDGTLGGWTPTARVVGVLLGFTALAGVWAVVTTSRYWVCPRRAVGTTAQCGLLSWAEAITLLAALVVPQQGLLVGLLGLSAVFLVTAVVPGLVLRSGVRRLASKRVGP